MFEGLKNMAGLAGLMKDLPRIKAKMDEVQERLERITVEAATGGGAVTVTANGKMRITSVKVDPALLAGLVDANDPADREIAEELIAGAVNAAMEKAKERAGAEFQEAAQDLGLPIPPGGLQGLMGS